MRAELHLQLHDRAGRRLAERRAGNAVMRDGATLVAQLFAGAATPITHMGVGTSDAAETGDFTTAALKNEEALGEPPLSGETEVALPSSAFAAPVVDADRRVVRLRVRATLPEASAVGTVREAGLLHRSGETARLYNRVVFAPVHKGDDHELTLFWEVTFPYGDLQWLH